MKALDMESVPGAIQAWLLLDPSLQALFDPNSTEVEFDDALEVKIAAAIRWLEENANALSPNGEDSLSTTLAGKISIEGLVDVTRETNSRGHVDITIKVITISRKRLGEAKIYDGYAYHEKGLQQLVDRYSTGRERSGYMFCYVKVSDIKGKMARLQAECDARKPCCQNAKSVEYKEKWAFETRHIHASGEELRVIHFGINLHVPTGRAERARNRGG
ncbi:MAG: hypothetical protein U5O69_06415 [Candidatus Competibacteraceae bacterium]|nr:hypothetical protein [Candidatus Competibacteraceae bacterium]